MIVIVIIIKYCPGQPFKLNDEEEIVEVNQN